jgi:hypothetical protein
VIKAEAEDEDDQSANDLGPWIKSMNPSIFVEVKKNVHIKFIILKLALQN